MCGIVGLFAKTAAFEAELGRHFALMLREMTDRGPDSAGFAVYRDAVPFGHIKLTLLAPAGFFWHDFEAALTSAFDGIERFTLHGNHAVLVTSVWLGDLVSWLDAGFPQLRVLSSGGAIEIYKEKGLPERVIEQFDVASMRASHALGHTRMATESAVTTEHSHPFSTGEDLCLVHNGSLSNHNRLRSELEKRGVRFATDNDSEVAAGYFTWRLREGDSLEQALTRGMRDLDGFYTFAVGTREGFAVLRDPIACKPAVIAESDAWVAMASEYRAIAMLPGADQARSWEPEPGRIYSWSH
ncbi:MAG: amidophosphoribosyltransferase [Gammaproteobacteria bacterium]